MTRMGWGREAPGETGCFLLSHSPALRLFRSELSYAHLLSRGVCYLVAQIELHMFLTTTRFYYILRNIELSYDEQ